MSRYYARSTDGNQTAIVAALRELGYGVACIHRAGNGIPDLVVSGYRHDTQQLENLLVEVKQPGQEKKLSPDERAFFAAWPGPAIVASDVETVLAWFRGGEA